MPPKIDEIRTRIRALEEALEEEYRLAREELARRKAALAGEFLRQQRRQKVGLLRFLRHSRIAVILTAPVIYAGWPVFMLLDLFVSLYQAICFPVYRIPHVRRRDYVTLDRGVLPYLNLIEKFNCFYCSYGNGVIAYAREIAARTEQHWCPIKHARRIAATHERYPDFFDYGDAEAYREGLEQLRHHNRQPPGTPPAP